MPIYERDGGFRITVWAQGRQHERRVQGPRELALTAEQQLRDELGAEDRRDTIGDVSAGAEVIWFGGYRKSYVYFVQQGEAGPVKIGFTRNARLRLGCIQTGNPERLYLRCVVAGGRELERTLHRALRRQHLHGEWFRVDSALAALMRELADCSHVRRNSGRNSGRRA